MQTFKIYELENFNSYRKPIIYSGTLRGAKSKATKEQLFKNTILKIENENGEIVAVKDCEGWHS